MKTELEIIQNLAKPAKEITKEFTVKFLSKILFFLIGGIILLMCMSSCTSFSSPEVVDKKLQELTPPILIISTSNHLDYTTIKVVDAKGQFLTISDESLSKDLKRGDTLVRKIKTKLDIAKEQYFENLKKLERQEQIFYLIKDDSIPPSK